MGGLLARATVPPLRYNLECEFMVPTSKTDYYKWQQCVMLREWKDLLKISWKVWLTQYRWSVRVSLVCFCFTDLVFLAHHRGVCSVSCVTCTTHHRGVCSVSCVTCTDASRRAETLRLDRNLRFHTYLNEDVGATSVVVVTDWQTISLAWCVVLHNRLGFFAFRCFFKHRSRVKRSFSVYALVWHVRVC